MMRILVIRACKLFAFDQWPALQAAMLRAPRERGAKGLVLKTEESINLCLMASRTAIHDFFWHCWSKRCLLDNS